MMMTMMLVVVLVLVVAQQEDIAVLLLFPRRTTQRTSVSRSLSVHGATDLPLMLVALRVDGWHNSIISPG